MKQWAATIAIILLPALTVGQSLGDLAKKERERRKKNQERGVKARTVTDQEVSTSSDSPPPESSARPPATDASASGRAAGASAKPPLKEQEWRYRAAQARSRVQKAQEKYDYLSRLSLVPGEYFVDEKGNPIITSLGQLQSMTRDAKAELDGAQKALADLLEEARRAGVPPGWLR